MASPLPNNLIADEANKLADRIRAYWRDRGHDVLLRIEKISYKDKIPTDKANRSMFQIRSNLLNGLPRTAHENNKRNN
jgi:hypothetical protein